jgi:undecaprenyl-diphosphatase
MNLNIWQTIFLALLQGVTELFPISSLGHTVIFPGLFGWGDLVRDQRFLPLIVALHLGTSIGLVIFFWRDWLQVILTLTRSVKEGEVHKGTDGWVSWLIIIGCIPAGLLGVFLETPLKLLFASPLIAASFLIVNGALLFLGERIRRLGPMRKTTLTTTDVLSISVPQTERSVLYEQETFYRPLSSLTWKDAVIVGFAQSLALIPGISRSGASIVAGLGVHLNHEDAARYSFLLGTPLIGAAALIELPQLIGQSASVWLLISVGMVLAGVAAYLSTRFLMKYFETGRLDPFAYYCWAMGLISLIILIFVMNSPR